MEAKNPKIRLIYYGDGISIQKRIGARGSMYTAVSLTNKEAKQVFMDLLKNYNTLHIPKKHKNTKYRTEKQIKDAWRRGELTDNQADRLLRRLN